MCLHNTWPAGSDDLGQIIRIFPHRIVWYLFKSPRGCDSNGLYNIILLKDYSHYRVEALCVRGIPVMF